jgi:aminopeptidase N
MSTYLFALVVSDYERIERRSLGHSVLVEVAARPEAIAKGHGSYALEQASSMIDFFIDYYNISYPLKKSSEYFLFFLFYFYDLYE